jgi:DMSO/TMAO reductase YedYZ molybdopterin-dependent catalytic subunit
MRESKVGPPLTGAAAEQEIRRLTRRSFLTGTGATLVGLAAWRWLTTADPEGDLPWPLRRVLRFNEELAEGLYSSSRLAPSFPAENVQNPARVNGLVGLANEIDPSVWQLRIQHIGRADRQRIGLKDLKSLPRTDLVTELKCVEGWSQVRHFSGVRFLDFLTRFGLGTRSGHAPDPQTNPQDLYPYVYLATPDEDYYVGLDMASALHPQTLLCDMENWQPLSREHGAPLRLYLAVKYGYKSLKRVGLIRFQDERPPDYWSERGYDWYAGH